MSEREPGSGKKNNEKKGLKRGIKNAQRMAYRETGMREADTFTIIYI
jgi:hypothetical protein